MKLDKNLNKPINFANGVTQAFEFELDPDCLTGDWKIEAFINDQMDVYNFKVDFYQRPLAYVNLTLPNYIDLNDDRLPNLIIQAYYTFGMPLKGYMDIEITRIKDCRGEKNKTKTLTGLKIDQKYVHLLEIRDLINTECAESQLKIHVGVNDMKTKLRYENFAFIMVYDQNMRAKSLDNGRGFRPGKPINHRVS